MVPPRNKAFNMPTASKPFYKKPKFIVPAMLLAMALTVGVGVLGVHVYQKSTMHAGSLSTETTETWTEKSESTTEKIEAFRLTSVEPQKPIGNATTTVRQILSTTETAEILVATTSPMDKFIAMTTATIQPDHVAVTQTSTSTSSSVTMTRSTTKRTGKHRRPTAAITSATTTTMGTGKRKRATSATTMATSMTTTQTTTTPSTLTTTRTPLTTTTTPLTTSTTSEPDFPERYPVTPPPVIDSFYIRADDMLPIFQRIDQYRAQSG